LLNVHGKTLCQSRQNHLDQQHTPNFTKRETYSYSTLHPQQAPLSRSDLVLEPLLTDAAVCLNVSFFCKRQKP
jgi:hypothetical protein